MATTPNSSHSHTVTGNKTNLNRAGTTDAILTDHESRIAAIEAKLNQPTPVPPEPTPVPPEPTPVPPPVTGIAVPASYNALKNAVAAAKTGDTFIPAPGTHGFDSGIGYAGIKISSALDKVTINGPGAILAPKGVANGIAILGDNCIIQGAQGTPMQIVADPAGPSSDANGSSLVAINGLMANNPDSPTNDTLLQDLLIKGAGPMTSSQHHVYLSGQLGGVTTLRRVQFVANGSKGYGLHDYHAGAAPSNEYLVEDCTFDGFAVAGVLLWNAVTKVTLRRCKFTNSAIYSMRLGTGGTVILDNCTADKPIKNEGTASIQQINGTNIPVTA